MSAFLLNNEQLNRLFPFHFIIDSDMMIVRAGKSLLKIFPSLVGNNFVASFELKRPSLHVFDFNDLAALNELVIIESTDTNSIVLKGQLEKVNEGTFLLFAGTPWFKSVEEVKDNGLSLNDFAINDPMIDLLHVLKTEEIAHSEIRNLLSQVNVQKNEFRAITLRLSQLITNLQTGILLEDEFRKIILTNNTFCQMFGIPVPPDQMVGWDCSDSAEQSKGMFKDPEKFVAGIATLLKDQVQVTGEVLELADGRVFERHYIPMFVENVYRGHLWMYTDITERARQQLLLRQSEEKYRGIITNINLGLIEVDTNEKIKYVNNSFSMLSGYTAEELLGKAPTEIFKLDTEQRQVMKKRNANRVKGISDVYEIRVTIKDGSQKWWAISGAPLYNDNGAVIGSIGIHLDITKQKTLELQLREAKLEAERTAQAKESFLANMSHEIRTPLSGIYGMMQLLQSTRLNQEQKGYIQSIDKAINNLQSIINDILDLSKINAGMVDIEFVEFNMREELEALSRLYKSKASDKGLKLEIDIEKNISNWFIGDPHRINQVITNLLGNSVKFTEQGSITIKCFKQDNVDDKELIAVCVEDTGIGMDASFMANIFEKFSQEESGHARKFGGTGLGMSITKKLVDLMQGSISIESEKHKGTKVTVTIPLKPTDKSEMTERKVLEEGMLRGKHILVAEDNEINASVIKSMLTREGALITLVGNGQLLTKAFETQEFDLVVSDIQMPVMDGLQAVRWIRKSGRTDLRVIALTANALSEERDRCFRAGFDEVVYKPFHRDQLLEACINTGSKRETTNIERLHPDSDELYNLDILREMLDNNEDYLNELLQKFLNETPNKLKALENAFEKRDIREVREMTHYLASSIHHLNIHSLTEVIKDIESKKITRSIRQLKMAVAFISETLDQVVQKIREDFPHLR